MAKKKEINELTVALIHQQSEIYKGPLDAIPDGISKKDIDEVKVFGEHSELVATMDCHDLAYLMHAMAS